MLDGPGEPRTPYKAVFHTLRSMTGSTLKERADILARSYLDQGVTFDYAGEERPFPLDAVPRVISAHEWQVIESGVAQRVAALEAFLDDIYSREGEIPRAVHEGVVPWRLIASSNHYHRAVTGIRPANGVRVHVAGVDLVRDEAGTFRVLEDNVRVPSGVSYVIANRRAMANVFPEAFATMRIRPVHDYPRMLLAALRAAAPDGASDPTVVVLTPGVFNSAYFEHALLARMMGVELVEGRDLVCVGGQVRMRTTTGDRPVDVIYRRVDDDFIDPVHFRGDSVLGVAGLTSAMRAGRVTVANAVGNGVADDKLIYSYLPELTRFYLDEDPILPNVDTFRCAEAGALEHVLGHLDEMVVKPVDGSGGKGLVVGPRADGPTLDRLRTTLEDDPRGWIAQPVVQLSTVPTFIDGGLAPRHVDLRPFAVNDGERVRVLPGGLTRVALPEGELVVNSSQGGGSKDTWVLSDRRASVPATAPHPDNREVVVMSAPTASLEDSMRAQQQQQQQLREEGEAPC
ncbi:circularly permuted type 2 ATP-grasp protein [Phycicoccus sonneratiae]|uniref:Circularly permuted type 2 ATP-grasp protein n=1 Tax=Phycicoccus sonneratiae TaxID=2807628 RepID=A0ABS2CGN8_9MICO|nr:circularly permuted type 2 ATP-grasp protein [Phycicoccus sonneraticus]MBM6398950.1 circularly permuted type 2 ATP-grasp protein [Phycicoccus sonneraticus]